MRGPTHFCIHASAVTFSKDCRARGELQKHAHSAKSKQVHHAEITEGELEGFRVGVQRIKLPVVINHGVGPRKHHLVAPTEFVDKAQDVLIALKPVMIEPFQGPVPMRRLEPGGQPTDLRRGLVDGYLYACLDQVECCGQAGHPCANNSHVSILCHSPQILILPAWSSPWPQTRPCDPVSSGRSGSLSAPTCTFSIVRRQFP